MHMDILEIGSNVVYVPSHARVNGVPNMKSSLCEVGKVSSCNDKYVFVKYYLGNGQIDERSKATKIEDLFFPNGDPVVDAVQTFLKLKGD